jgi:hypothetical protein
MASTHLTITSLLLIYVSQKARDALQARREHRLPSTAEVLKMSPAG